MQTQGRKEVRDAVAIAVLTSLGTALISMASDLAREAWADYRKRRKKRSAQKQAPSGE